MANEIETHIQLKPFLLNLIHAKGFQVMENKVESLFLLLLLLHKLGP